MSARLDPIGSIEQRASLPGGMYEPAWLTVQTWKHGDAELRGEAKLAWWWLWASAGFRPNSITVNVNELAARQGTSNGAGNRYLKTLLAAGLIEQCGKPFRGIWHVYVLDPADVLRGVRRASVDPQQDLFEKFEPDVEDPDEQDDSQVRSLNVNVSEVRAAVPSRIRDGTGAEPRAPLKPLNVLNKYPSTFKPFEVLEDSALAPRLEGKGGERGTAATEPRPNLELAALQSLVDRQAEAARSQVATHRPPAAGNDQLRMILDQVVSAKLPSEAERQRMIEELATLIKRRVDDPARWPDNELRPSIALRVATAIVEKQGDPAISRGDLLQCLHHMADMRRKNQFKNPPPAYFAKRMQNLFRERGELWR